MVESDFHHHAWRFYVFRARTARRCSTDDDRRSLGSDEFHHASDVVAVGNVLLVRTVSASPATVHQSPAAHRAKLHASLGNERRRTTLVKLDPDNHNACMVCGQFCCCIEDLQVAMNPVKSAKNLSANVDFDSYRSTYY